MTDYSHYKKIFKKGINIIRFARVKSKNRFNPSEAILAAYDLQAGNYLYLNRQNPKKYKKIHLQVADCIKMAAHRLRKKPYSLLEVGVGDGTTLRGVLSLLGKNVSQGLGFDISCSRIKVAKKWICSKYPKTVLFVATLFKIPLPDNCVDVVYSHHSLEPNGGREVEAIKECLRIARHRVVLVEPFFEMASARARKRMLYHGYAKNLAGYAKKNGAKIFHHHLLPWQRNPLNPSGVLILGKKSKVRKRHKMPKLICPVTRTRLTRRGSFLWSKQAKLAYPIFQGTPMLRPENAIFASCN